MESPPRIHVLLDDLFVRARIETTARALGVDVAFAARAELLPAAGPPGATVLVDLAHPEAIETIRALALRPDPPRVVAWGSHVDGERMTAAREAGATKVLARSAFTARLAEILRPDGADRRPNPDDGES